MGWCDAARALETPYFDGIRPLLQELSSATWPTLSQLNALAVKFAIRNSLGVPIQFVPPSVDTISAMRSNAWANCGLIIIFLYARSYKPAEGRKPQLSVGSGWTTIVAIGSAVWIANYSALFPG